MATAASQNTDDVRTTEVPGRHRHLFWIATVLLFVVSAAAALHPRWTTAPGLPANLVPFTFIGGLLRPGTMAEEVQNFLGNTVLYVPSAVLLALVVRRWWVVVAIVTGVAAIVEFIQWQMANRVADIDDVILAGIGAAAAVAITRLLTRLYRRLRAT